MSKIWDHYEARVLLTKSQEKSSKQKNTTLTQTGSPLAVLKKQLLDGQPNGFTNKQLYLQQFRNLKLP